MKLSTRAQTHVYIWDMGKIENGGGGYYVLEEDEHN